MKNEKKKAKQRKQNREFDYGDAPTVNFSVQFFQRNAISTAKTICSLAN